MNPADENPIEQLAELRQISPPPSLVARVMREVTEPAPFRFWDWLRARRRFEITASPVGITAGLVLVAVVAWGGTNWDRRPQTHAPAGPVSVNPTVAVNSAQPDVVLVRFVLTARGAQQVTLAGDFNGWDPGATALSEVGPDGTFTATVPLARGTTHEYMFVVDGQWTPDPASENLQPDGFGLQNSVLRL